MFQVQVNLTVCPTFKWALHGWKFTRARLYGCTAGPLAVPPLPSHGRREVVHCPHKWETDSSCCHLSYYSITIFRVVTLVIFCLVFSFLWVFLSVSSCVLVFVQAIPSHGFHQFKSNSLDVLQRRIEELQVCPSVWCLSHASHPTCLASLTLTKICELTAWSFIYSCDIH